MANVTDVGAPAGAWWTRRVRVGDLARAVWAWRWRTAVAIIVLAAVAVLAERRKADVFRFELVAPMDRAGIERLASNSYVNEYACFVQTGPECSKEQPFDIKMVRTALQRETELSDVHERFASFYAATPHDPRLDALAPKFAQAFVAERRADDVLIAYNGSDDAQVVRGMLSLVAVFVNKQASEYVRKNAVPYLDRLRALAIKRQQSFSPTIPDPALRASEVRTLEDFRRALDGVSLDAEYQLIRDTGTFVATPVKIGIIPTAFAYALLGLTLGLTGAVLDVLFRRK